ncbi:MAG: GNAT family N-acetyltransferase, partial [Pseudomonadota bacterium]
IYADPAWRRRGIATTVVAALEAIARAGGATVLRLETGLASPDALALYDRLGYRRRGPFGAYVENGSSVFMEKPA